MAKKNKTDQIIQIKKRKEYGSNILKFNISSTMVFKCNQDLSLLQ